MTEDLTAGKHLVTCTHTCTFTCPINFNVLQAYKNSLLSYNKKTFFFFFLQPPLQQTTSWMERKYSRFKWWYGKMNIWWWSLQLCPCGYHGHVYLKAFGGGQHFLSFLCFTGRRVTFLRRDDSIMTMMTWKSFATFALHGLSPLHCHGNQRFRSPQVSTVTDLLSFISVARATQPWLIDGILVVLQQKGWRRGSPNNWIFSPSKHLYDTYVMLTYSSLVCIQCVHNRNFLCRDTLTHHVCAGTCCQCISPPVHFTHFHHCCSAVVQHKFCCLTAKIPQPLRLTRNQPILWN